MRKLLSLIPFVCLFLFARPVSAQFKNIDSLKQRLDNERADTVKVMIYRDLSNEYRENFKPDLAFDAAKAGLELAQRIGFKKGEAALLNVKGRVLAAQGNRSEAIKLYLQALRITEQTGDHEQMSRNLNNVALYYYNSLGDTVNALIYYRRAMDAADKITVKDGKRFIPITLVNLGAHYLVLKQFDSAKYYVDRYYEMGRIQNDRSAMINGLGYKGLIAQEMGEYEVALAYMRSANAIWQQLTPHLAGGWSPMAELFEKMGRYDSALYYSRKAMLQYIDRKSPVDIARVGKLMVRLFERQQQPDSALHYLKLTTAANDTLNIRSKTAEIANALFNEKLREDERTRADKKAAEDRWHNLQYAAIALALVAFIILFFLFSHSIVANQKLIRFLGVIALLIVFEFLNLLLHPWLGAITHHSPVLMLLAMVCVAALLIPLHHKLEHWITHKLVEKNKKIRLAAAKRIISQFEPKPPINAA